MFGSTYILDARARFLWGLDRGLRLAVDGPAPLAELALRLAEAPIGDAIEELKDIPFHTMWIAVLANQMRFGGPLPEAAIATGFLALADVVGIQATKEVFYFARDTNGRYLTPGEGRCILEVDKFGKAKIRANVGCNGLLLMGDNVFLRHLIGESPSAVSVSTESWEASLSDGMALLAEVSPEQHQRVLKHISVVANFEAERGLLQSLSIGEWPGCVIARFENSPAHVCDQLVHEASHQLLDVEFSSRQELVEQLEHAPVAYSPFFRQPRPCIKLIHGLVSYLEVLRFWRSMIEKRAWSAQLSESVAQSRFDHVKGLCVEGIRSLRAAAPTDVWADWHKFIAEIAPEILQVDGDVPETFVGASVSKFGSVIVTRLPLSPISRSEVLLALEGAKVSRVSLTLDEAAQLARTMSPHSVPLFSRAVMITQHEHLKGAFSNMTSGTFEYYKPPPGAFVYGYVSNSPTLLRLAVSADEENDAGSFFGIPSCCCEFFKKHWEDARLKYHGDLASLLLSERRIKDKPEMYPWQTNPFAMYFGKGITWHFPCSWECPATIDAINERANLLDRLLPDEAREFRRWQLRPIVWSKTHGIFAAGIGGGPHRINLNDSVSLEESPGLERLRRAVELEWRDSAWQTPKGELLAELLDPEAHVLLWR